MHIELQQRRAQIWECRLAPVISSTLPRSSEEEDDDEDDDEEEGEERGSVDPLFFL